MKRLSVLILCAVFLLTGCASSEDSGRIKVVATNFAMYDFARAVCGDECDVEMLLKPGAESHDFEATLGDVAKIASADIFVCVGGSDEDWIHGVFDTIGSDADKIIRIEALNCVETCSLGDHDDHDGHSHNEEVDEHVWTSIPNAILIIERIEEAVCSILPESAEKIKANTEEYIGKLRDIDSRMTEMIGEAELKTIVVADRFPFLYMTEHYGLQHYAAFDGCTSSTEPTLAVINSLINIIRENEIDCVIVAEFSDRKTAQAISNETGCEIYEMSSAHNVTRSDFDSGITYADIMEKNMETLEKVLN